MDIRELIGSNEFDLGGMRAKTAEMTHSMYDLAYRFDVDGKSVVVSGDTAFDPRLIALAEGADVLVIDASLGRRHHVASTSQAPHRAAGGIPGDSPLPG